MNIYNDDTIKRSRGLFRFDLTGVDKANITSAKLKLWTDIPVTSAIDYEIYTITGAWREGTGTWNNGDCSGMVCNNGLNFGNAVIFAGRMSVGEEFIEADVTNQVLAWLNGTPNNGFMLQHLAVWRSLEIISSEKGLPEMRPTLEIGYNTPSGQWNYAPVLGPIGAKSVNKGAKLSFTVNATDRDPGDTLTYSVSPFSPSMLPAGKPARKWRLWWHGH